MSRFYGFHYMAKHGSPPQAVENKAEGNGEPDADIGKLILFVALPLAILAILLLLFTA
jgi:hypothetical protein